MVGWMIPAQTREYQERPPVIIMNPAGAIQLIAVPVGCLPGPHMVM